MKRRVDVVTATPLKASLHEQSKLVRLIEKGLAGLKDVDRNRIAVAIRNKFQDSLDLDAALLTDHQGEHRWDYLLSYQETWVVAVEVHSANTSEVSVLIQKKKAAKRQLQAHMRPTGHIAKWIWISSGAVAIPQLDRARTRLAQEGIMLVGRELAAKHVP